MYNKYRRYRIPEYLRFWDHRTFYFFVKKTIFIVSHKKIAMWIPRLIIATQLKNISNTINATNQLDEYQKQKFYKNYIKQQNKELQKKWLNQKIQLAMDFNNKLSNVYKEMMQEMGGNLIFGDFNRVENKRLFSHALQFVNNPFEMDEFNLEEIQTVCSDDNGMWVDSDFSQNSECDIISIVYSSDSCCSIEEI